MYKQEHAKLILENKFIYRRDGRWVRIYGDIDRWGESCWTFVLPLLCREYKISFGRVVTLIDFWDVCLPDGAVIDIDKLEGHS